MNKIVAGTGHRPKYLPCKYDTSHEFYVKLKKTLDEAIKKEKPECIITGMALGWDILLAESALNNGVPMHCYIPFDGQEKGWPPEQQEIYNRIIDKANTVIIFNKEYHKDAYFNRDKAMVDDCDELWTLFNGSPKTGTGYTMRYAKSVNRPMRHFWKGME